MCDGDSYKNLVNTCYYMLLQLRLVLSSSAAREHLETFADSYGQQVC